MKINNFFETLKKYFNRFEAKYEKYTINGLMYYIAGLMIVVCFLNSNGYNASERLILDKTSLMKGEIWRLITFLFVPINNNPIYLFFELAILIMCAKGIEEAMGSFKLSLYYFIGAIFMIIATLIEPRIQQSSYMMYLSLFFGYATLYPDVELLFMFIIPIKIKYLAILSSVGIILTLFFASWATKIAVILSMANYLIFFAVPAFMGIKHERQQAKRRAAFEKAVTPNKEYRHKCSVCGITDVTNPEIVFKYCVCKKCGENGVCFCPEHLKEHKERINS